MNYTYNIAHKKKEKKKHINMKAQTGSNSKLLIDETMGQK